jgi:hypothetical protein
MPSMTRFTLVAVAGLISALPGCAAPRTQLAPVPKAAVRAEQEKQRELALEDNRQQQQRLDSLAFPILLSGTGLCTDNLGRRLSARFATVHQYEAPLRQAAARALLVSDTITVIGVTPSGAAARAGIQVGDKILAVEGGRVETGVGALKDFSAKVTAAKQRDPVQLRLTVSGARGPERVTVAYDRVCDYDNIVVQADELNAFSDGSNIFMTSTMMRFANDQELQVVYAHEFAHNAMGHIKAKKKNTLFGALLGALADIALNARGVHTGGYYTSRGASAGAMAFSQDFEREADYVGLYAMALADASLTSAPAFWRHMAMANPKSIGLAHSHPTTAERFVRMERAIAEIDHKRALNIALRPEMKGDAHRADPAPEGGYVMAGAQGGPAPQAAAFAPSRPDSTTQAQHGRTSARSLAAPQSQAYSAYSTGVTETSPASLQGEDRTTPVPASSQTAPAAGYTKLPPGTYWIGDARIKRYYSVGCAAQHVIPTEEQIFFQTSEGAARDGFVRSGDC